MVVAVAQCADAIVYVADDANTKVVYMRIQHKSEQLCLRYRRSDTRELEAKV